MVKFSGLYEDWNPFVRFSTIRTCSQFQRSLLHASSPHFPHSRASSVRTHHKLTPSRTVCTKRTSLRSLDLHLPNVHGRLERTSPTHPSVCAHALASLRIAPASLRITLPTTMHSIRTRRNLTTLFGYSRPTFSCLDGTSQPTSYNSGRR